MRKLSNKWATSRQNQHTDVRADQPDQFSLGIRPVWSESSLCTQWVAKDPTFLHADSENSDQTGQMPRLILSLHWAHMPFCWFCHEAAQILCNNNWENPEWLFDVNRRLCLSWSPLQSIKMHFVFPYELICVTMILSRIGKAFGLYNPFVIPDSYKSSWLHVSFVIRWIQESQVRTPAWSHNFCGDWSWNDYGNSLASTDSKLLAKVFALSTG